MADKADPRVPPRHANELDGKTWTRYSISIWSDIRKTEEELRLTHPAMFPTQLVTRLLECFTTSDDRVVLDPFAGVGSTLVASERMGKRGVGFEVSSEFVEIARRRLCQKLLWSTEQRASVIYHADANCILEYLPPESVDFVVTSPPYWDILTRKRTADKKEARNYGDTKTDLGKIASYQDFLAALAEVFQQVLQVLRAGKYCIVVAMDIRKESTFYPFHADIANMMQKIGFIYDDLIVWDRRHEYNNMRPLGYPYVFRVNKAHEFILIFRKPKH